MLMFTNVIINTRNVYFIVRCNNNYYNLLSTAAVGGDPDRCSFKCASLLVRHKIM